MHKTDDLHILSSNLYEIIEKYSNQKIGLAVSGGSDSIFLLHFFSKLSKNLVVLHINHQTRPESMKEESFIQNYSNELGVESYILRADNLNLEMPNFEHYAREARYTLLNDIARKIGLPCILTAHNQEDVVETVFLKLLRGNKSIFIRSHRLIQKNSPIELIRPMLHLKKKTILDYLAKYHQKYLEDPSNNNTKYRRNFLRIIIFPILRKYISGFNERISALSYEFLEQERFLRKYTKSVEERIFINNYCLLDDLAKEDEFIQKNIIQNKCYQIFDIQLTRKQLKNILVLLFQNEKKSMILYENNNKKIVKEDKYLIFIFKNEGKNIEKKIIILHNNKYTSRIENWYIKEIVGQGLMFDSDDLIVCRSLNIDDKIIWGSGHKKIVSLLKDRKNPLFLRDKAMVIEKNNKIVGVLAFNFIYIIREECAEKTKKGLFFIPNQLSKKDFQ